MKCEEVQLKFPEISVRENNFPAEMEHIKNCKKCKNEYDDFKLISSSIFNLNDPIPTIISRQNQEIIKGKIERQTFVNRIKIISSIAAVLVISLISTIIFQQSKENNFYYDSSNIAYSESNPVIEFELSDEEILDYLISTETKNKLDEIIKEEFPQIDTKNGS
ncbi:MAG: hypothetical protein U9N76_04070 [Candidatus Marinimicrobia bacterium]|nr:hypothetical protein [Candidatus Neomarinimicrobiota bacterium]